jgi:polyphosphate glucokinase
MKILVIDVGGTHVKMLVTGQRKHLLFVSGPDMTAKRMVANVKKTMLEAGWTYDAISIGYPGPVQHNRPIAEPHNLGPGWVRFNFHKTFGYPVKIINDAAMQALGSYRRGHMLFLGLGTGLGSALVTDSLLVPLELAHLPFKKGQTYEDFVGLRGLKRYGKKKWRKYVLEVVEQLRAALLAQYVVLGGGNARLMKKLPPHVRLGDNANAFRGGFRLWQGKQASRFLD